MERSASDLANPRRRFPKPAVRILKEWFRQHSEHPFPSDEDKNWLQEQSGLSKKQITFWFTNARRRGIVRGIEPNVEVRQRQWNFMSALDRWQHSPPELEPAAFSDIANAVANIGMSGSTQPSQSGNRPILASTYASSSVGTSSGKSEAMSSWSNSDASSASQTLTYQSVGRDCKRRHRGKKQKISTSSSKPTPNRRYQCTFCTDRFKTKYDWTRHETTQHLILEIWTCAPAGPRVHPVGRRPECAYCGIPDPTDSHFEEHNHMDCSKRVLAARTFYRKDHLRQHLYLFHGIKQCSSQIDEWKMTTTGINCRCGFCEATFDDWLTRNDHLAQHFQAGWQMKDWKGGLGLDLAVATLVRNAMPPYLIGEEATTLVPFSVKNGTAQETTDYPFKNPEHGLQGLQPGLNWFDEIVARLSGFVRECKARSVIPTDEMLQRQARLLIFGEDDPWNQTAADNPDWLHMFKIGHGLNETGLRDTQTFKTLERSPICDSMTGHDFNLALSFYCQNPEYLVNSGKLQSATALIDIPEADQGPQIVRSRSHTPGTSCESSRSNEHRVPGLRNSNFSYEELDLTQPALGSIGLDPDWCLWLADEEDGGQFSELYSGSSSGHTPFQPNL